MVLKGPSFVGTVNCSSLLGAGVLGHGLGSLGYGVLGQLTGQEETDSGLDLSAGDGGPSVVVGQTGGLSGDTLEDVIHEGVHDRHGLAAYTSVRLYSTLGTLSQLKSLLKFLSICTIIFTSVFAKN